MPVDEAGLCVHGRIFRIRYGTSVRNTVGSRFLDSQVGRRRCRIGAGHAATGASDRALLRDQLGDLHEAASELGHDLRHLLGFRLVEVALGLLLEDAEEVDGELRAGKVDDDAVVSDVVLALV